jgi:hypothetical protein
MTNLFILFLYGLLFLYLLTISVWWIRCIT